MKLKMITTVWAGEFDESEFPHYESHRRVVTGHGSSNIEVTEVIEFDPERTHIKFEA